MSDDLIDRLRSPEEIVLPTGTRIILDNGKKMGRYWLELLEPFSVWVSSSLKMDAAAEIVTLRVENDHLRQARSDDLAGGDALREEIERLRAEVLEQARLLGMGSEREAKLLARVEVLEKVRIAAQAFINFDALAAALEEAEL
jgi:hypothetical protein